MPKSRKRPAAARKQRAERAHAPLLREIERRGLTPEMVMQRVSYWLAEDGTALPRPSLLHPAGGLDGIRAHPCPRCAAATGHGCINEAGTGTGEHLERVDVALHARGLDRDHTSACGSRNDDGTWCTAEPLPGDYFCFPHRALLNYAPA